MKYLACIFFLMLSSFQKKEPIPVLIIDGFSNHDWRQTSDLTKRILEESGRFKVAVFTIPPNDSTWQPPAFKHYAVVIQNTNNIFNLGIRWPRKAERELEDYVRKGGSLYVLHSANNAFPHWEEYNKMIGIGWRSRTTGYAIQIDSNKHIVRIPPGEGEGTGHGSRFNAVVQILNRHPVNKDYPAQWKTASTEVYNYPRGPAENLTVLSFAYDSSATHKMWPVEWIVKYGKGHVYSSSMGHLWKGEIYPMSYRCIGFQTTMIRVTEWLATGKVTYHVPKNFPSADAISLRNETDFPNSPKF